MGIVFIVTYAVVQIGLIVGLIAAGWLIAWHALIKKQKIVQELLGIEPTMVAGSGAMASQEQRQPSPSIAVASQHGISHLNRQAKQTGSSSSGGREQLQQSAGELHDEGEKQGGDDGDDGDYGGEGAVQHAAFVEEHED